MRDQYFGYVRGLYGPWPSLDLREIWLISDPWRTFWWITNHSWSAMMSVYIYYMYDVCKLRSMVSGVGISISSTVIIYRIRKNSR
jgi:hypothetical protein